MHINFCILFKLFFCHGILSLRSSQIRLAVVNGEGKWESTTFPLRNHLEIKFALVWTLHVLRIFWACYVPKRVSTLTHAHIRQGHVTGLYIFPITPISRSLTVNWRSQKTNQQNQYSKVFVHPSHDSLNGIVPCSLECARPITLNTQTTHGIHYLRRALSFSSMY
jgi:hypothetical protein